MSSGSRCPRPEGVRESAVSGGIGAPDSRLTRGGLWGTPGASCPLGSRFFHEYDPAPPMRGRRSRRSLGGMCSGPPWSITLAAAVSASLRGLCSGTVNLGPRCSAAARSTQAMPISTRVAARWSCSAWSPTSGLPGVSPAWQAGADGLGSPTAPARHSPFFSNQTNRPITAPAKGTATSQGETPRVPGRSSLP